MAKRQWSDEQKASALAWLEANDGNVQRTAEQLKAAGMDVPYMTLKNWANGQHINESVTNISNEKKAEITEQLDLVIATLAQDLLDASKRADANLKDVATAMGIAIDKNQLLRGKATSINEHVSREERIHRVAELLERRGVGAAGRGPSGDRDDQHRESA